MSQASIRRQVASAGIAISDCASLFQPQLEEDDPTHEQLLLFIFDSESSAQTRMLTLPLKTKIQLFQRALADHPQSSSGKDLLDFLNETSLMITRNKTLSMSERLELIKDHTVLSYIKHLKDGTPSEVEEEFKKEAIEILKEKGWTDSEIEEFLFRH